MFLEFRKNRKDQFVKGTIKKIKDGVNEILVKPDHGGDVFVAFDPFGELLFAGLREEYEPTIKAMLIKNAPEGHVVCFEGDRISYKKTGTGTYEIRALLVHKLDPRQGLKGVRLE